MTSNVVLSGEVFAGGSQLKHPSDEHAVFLSCEDGWKAEHGTSCTLTSGMKDGIIGHLHEELRDGVHATQSILGTCQLDLLEICAPWDSPLSAAMRDIGGRAMSLGVHNGFDLTTRAGFLRAAQVTRKLRPRYMHISPPCDPWTALQNCNQRTDVQRARLEAKQHVHKRLLKHCRKLAEIQKCELNNDWGLDTECLNHHVGGEHPLAAQSWSVHDMKIMARLGGGRFTVHGCRHGMKNSKTGKFLRKPWGWFSSHAGVRKALELKCNHERHMHDLIQGSLTAPTAIYPRLLCLRFAKALMQDEEELFNMFHHDVEMVNEDDGYVFVGENEEPEADDGPREGDRNPQEAPMPGARLPGPAEGAEGDQGEQDDVGEIRRKLRVIHRNLGHPCQATLVRLLREAGASEAVLQQARQFECDDCNKRGRRSSTRQSIPHVVYEKPYCFD